MFFSIPLTFANLPFGNAREAISFNLSGPLTLAVSVMYFSKQAVSKLDIQNIILAFVMPAVSIATINIQGILSRSSIVFSNNSNFATSGGFGPNQVSAILGLAGLFLILLFVVVGVKWYRFIIYVGLALIFIVLSAITFSRGGLFNVVGSIIAILTLTLFKPKIQATLLAVSVAFWVAWSFGVGAWLNRFTGGAFSVRFSDTDTTGRLELVMIQYELWKRNFVFGVGPGMANWEYLKTFGRSMASHTEYSRMLVEHGLFGLGSMLLMFWMPIQQFFSKRNQISKIWLSAMVVWSMIEMSHAATRIAAVGFVFGLGFITIDKE